MALTFDIYMFVGGGGIFSEFYSQFLGRCIGGNSSNQALKENKSKSIHCIGKGQIPTPLALMVIMLIK